MRKVIALIVVGLAATHEPQADKRKGSYLRGGGAGKPGKVDDQFDGTRWVVHKYPGRKGRSE